MFERASSSEESYTSEDGTSEEDLGTTRSKSRTFQLLVGVAGVLAMSGAAAMALMQGPAGPKSGDKSFSLQPVSQQAIGLSARKLLESPELVEAATDQLINGGKQALTINDRSLVRSTVKNGLTTFTKLLSQRNPKAFTQLDSFMLSQEHKEAILHVVGSMSDTRVQSLGVELAGAVREFLLVPGDVKQMQLKIASAMQPHLGKIRKLREEVIPGVLRHGSSSAGGALDVNIDTQSLSVVNTFQNSWHMEFQMSRPLQTARRLLLGSAPPQVDYEKSVGIAGGIVEQTRVVMKALNTVMDKYNINLQVPPWVTQAEGQPNYAEELLGCMVANTGDMTKSIHCPMKFGSAGIEVLSSVKD